MKKYLGIFIATILYFGMTCNIASALDASDLKINGEVNTLIKMQDSYFTPLDSAGEREGANWRNDQMFRAIGKLTFSYGDLGNSKWFAAAEIKFDANDPDATGTPTTMITGYNAADDELVEMTLDNESKNLDILNLDHAFIMYRPFEMKGGRPLGIMLGRIPYKATANAAYFHLFQGDPDEDFIYYTGAALTEATGIGLDFHIAPDTGIGFGYSSTAGDASKIVFQVNGDGGVKNMVLWAEAKKWNIGFNAAMQMISGNSETGKEVTTSMENTYNEYDMEYDHTVINAGLSYTLELGSLKFMPFLGYQAMNGDDVEDRAVEGSILSGGLKICTNFSNMPGELNVLYCDSNTPDIDGIAVLPSGYIDSNIVTLLNATDPTGLMASTFTAKAPTLSAEGGDYKTAMALTGIDNTIHLEYSMELSKNVKIGAFYHALKSGTDDTITASHIANQLSGTIQALSYTMVYAEAFATALGLGADQAAAATAAATAADAAEAAGGDPTANAMAAASLDPQIQELATGLQQNTEWTDTNSFGLFCNISF